MLNIEKILYYPRPIMMQDLNWHISLWIKKPRWALWLEYRIKKNKKVKPLKVHDFKNRDFDTFFDDANGKKIWNREQLKATERSGQVMLTAREAQQEYKRAKRYKEEKFRRKSAKLFEQKLAKLQQGYSYAKQFSNAEKFSQEALHRHLKEA